MHLNYRTSVLIASAGALLTFPAFGSAWSELPCGETEETAHTCAPGEVARDGTVPNPAPSPAPVPPTPELPPAAVVPPAVVVPPPTPVPTCAELRARYPKAGRRRQINWGCAVPPTPPPPRSKHEVCERPATLRIVQQQKGTTWTETYPLGVVIRNTTGARTPAGALVLTDSGLQNFVAPNGGRTERLVIPVGPMRRGQARVVDRTMGFVGVEAFREVFTTYATFHVNGRVCGYAMDKAFEG